MNTFRDIDIVLKELMDKAIETAKAKQQTYGDVWKSREFWWLAKKVKNKANDLWDVVNIKITKSELENIIIDLLVYVAMSYEKKLKE